MERTGRQFLLRDGPRRSRGRRGDASVHARPRRRGRVVHRLEGVQEDVLHADVVLVDAVEAGLTLALEERSAAVRLGRAARAKEEKDARSRSASRGRRRSGGSRSVRSHEEGKKSGTRAQKVIAARGDRGSDTPRAAPHLAVARVRIAANSTTVARASVFRSSSVGRACQWTNTSAHLTSIGTCDWRPGGSTRDSGVSQVLFPAVAAAARGSHSFTWGRPGAFYPGFTTRPRPTPPKV